MVVESGMVVGPELVVGSCVHGVRAAWLCTGPGLVLRVVLVVDGNRAGCAWGQGWVVGVGLVVHGVRASM